MKLFCLMRLAAVLSLMCFISGCALVTHNAGNCSESEVNDVETLTLFHIKLNNALSPYGLYGSYSGNLAHSGPGLSISAPSGLQDWIISSTRGLQCVDGSVTPTIIGLRLIKGRKEKALGYCVLKGIPTSIVNDEFYDVIKVDALLKHNKLPAIRDLLKDL